MDEKQITDKQWSVINDITHELGYIFSGKSRKDASDFIGKYLPKLKAYYADINLMYEMNDYRD